ncbi:MAG: hypothetical protein KDD45_03030 [Bdellovibrionales bacterium]|nr:hypothetical protein [Bdellovibrionales bacterium]
MKEVDFKNLKMLVFTVLLGTSFLSAAQGERQESVTYVGQGTLRVFGHNNLPIKCEISISSADKSSINAQVKLSSNQLQQDYQESMKIAEGSFFDFVDYTTFRSLVKWRDINGTHDFGYRYSTDITNKKIKYFGRFFEQHNQQMYEDRIITVRSKYPNEMEYFCRDMQKI